jgi:hypothetical protein
MAAEKVPVSAVPAGGDADGAAGVGGGALITGYLHPAYARSLEEFGNPWELPRCGGWILRRGIPGFSYEDGMGCYPLFACRDWSGLAADLDDLKGDLVSLSLVADPFGLHNDASLRGCFDVVVPYKKHFVVDLDPSLERRISKHHSARVRRALRWVHVEDCPDPSALLDDWVRLYSTLVARHRVTGIRAFSRNAFEKQLRVPGTVIFRAVSGGLTVGAAWWFHQGEVAYGHLLALSSVGYKLGAAYALNMTAIEFFSTRARWLDLGGGAGITDDETGGLSSFKRGWSTETRTAYFCGRILDPERYTQLTRSVGGEETTYFPAYRAGEFG